MVHAARRIGWMVMVLALTCAAWADVPWKRADEAADAPATLEEIKADVGNAQYDRLIGRIEAKRALAEKAMEPYHKEMEKPPEKRRPALLQKCKVRSAQMYEAAAKAAKRACYVLQKKSHRAAIKQQFEEPNRHEAARIYLELSTDARAEGRLAQAAIFCKKALQADPENEGAKQRLKHLAEEYRQAVRDRRNRSRGGGGSDGKRRHWDLDYDEKWDPDDKHDRDWSDWRNLMGR